MILIHFLTFFWQDEDLEKIVIETNIYIDKKIERRKGQRTKLTTLAEENLRGLWVVFCIWLLLDCKILEITGQKELKI